MRLREATLSGELVSLGSLNWLPFGVSGIGVGLFDFLTVGVEAIPVDAYFFIDL